MGRAERISASISRVFAPLIDLVFPPRCPLCGAATAAQAGLCGACWGQLVIPGEPACISCSRPFAPDSGLEGSTCAACLASPPKHAGIAAATLYNDISRRMILAFKHGGKIALAPQLARLMAAKLPDHAGTPPLIVPVPLHRWRLWRRGFNQAALLARELAQLGKGDMLVDALVRVRSTAMLGGMRRVERQSALRGAIQVNSRRMEQLRGRAVILVDDVLTSGATSDACISALRKAGAGPVTICCFARVLDEALHGEHAAHGDGERRFEVPENITPEAKLTSGAT